MRDFGELDEAVAALANRFSPAQRRTLLTKISKYLQSANRKRMTAQTGPEGDAWQERQGAPRNGKSTKMMAGLKKHLKIKVSPNDASIGFAGRAGKIALIHHEGLMDAVSDGGPLVRYKVRELLGIAGDDLAALEDIILHHS